MSGEQQQHMPQNTTISNVNGKSDTMNVYFTSTSGAPLIIPDKLSATNITDEVTDDINSLEWCDLKVTGDRQSEGGDLMGDVNEKHKRRGRLTLKPIIDPELLSVLTQSIQTLDLTLKTHCKAIKGFMGVKEMKTTKDITTANKEKQRGKYLQLEQEHKVIDQRIIILCHFLCTVYLAYSFLI